jgi:hypothetical protein
MMFFPLTRWPSTSLLSAAANTFSLASVARMSDEEARAWFQRIRWANNDGEPYCPRCDTVYD